MATALYKRRKHELKELASNLGLSNEGSRESLADRIKLHVAKHGTADPSLRDLVREDSPRTSRRSTESARLANLSSANDDDTSDSGTHTRSMRSSPTKRRVVARTGTDSDSAEDPLSVQQVRNFMDNMQTDLHQAKEKAQHLEHALHDKFQSGKASLNRASRDLTSSVTHAVDDVVDSVSGLGARRSFRRGSRHHDDEDDDDEDAGRHGRSRHRHHRHHGHEEQGWCSWVVGEVRHRFTDCVGACGFSTCMSRNWERLHDLGSSSLGYVWITFVLELIVFTSAAHSQHGHDYDTNNWLSCLHFLANWDNFLRPFFSYYGTLFVIPTLLSQLFNVDRASKQRPREDDHHHEPPVTGLLARKTTSGLSFFVFKFALTYFLSQSATHVHSLGGMASLAKEAAASHHHHHHHHTLWGGCKYLAEVFRYVPASLGLATSGTGTVLALAESIVSRRR
ncbi:hypothetical protein BGZ70_003123 [Mortierella alpina]|uniref:SAP domain-containing protein n=1 Tax=Mortierella alpina TaxID=64518 RepID=A0A9P6M5D1_MORAP|nr:hypothetical protein BGZ70_003123 [Mortierella alpina]